MHFNEDRQFAVGIDFGTTNSSIAIARRRGDRTDRVSQLSNWRGDGGGDDLLLSLGALSGSG